MGKDYKSLYLKYKNKYIHSKKNLKGGSQSFDSLSTDKFGDSALTIDPGAESREESILLPPSPLKKDPETPTRKCEFEKIFNPKIEGNRYVSVQKPIDFKFEKMNFIKCDENKFVTLFTSKKLSEYRYYFKIGDLEKNIDYEELLPLEVSKPIVNHQGPRGSGFIEYENPDFIPRRKNFIDRHQFRVGNQTIYLFVNENYRLFYFIDKNTKFIFDPDLDEKESKLFIDYKGFNNEELADPIIDRRNKIIKLGEEK